MKTSRKIAAIGKECVACGSCLHVCPKEAIQIAWGISACVDQAKCVGCGKCAKVCPAAVINIVERSAAL
ncbi:MAG TPA: 4Fe-4S binding protein [Candidatus Mediterraneibacter pullistercoris]|mgnify:CR=1 FL=1|nr:4Fe-4S binding protein [Candidatus Mediterraneibacter pullistercoris]